MPRRKSKNIFTTEKLEYGAAPKSTRIKDNHLSDLSDDEEGEAKKKKKKKEKRKKRESKESPRENGNEDDTFSNAKDKLRKLTRSLSSESLTPSGLTKCQTILCLLVTGFVIGGIGVSIICVGLLVLDIPDLYNALGPCLTAAGLILISVAIFLFIRWIFRKRRRIRHEKMLEETENPVMNITAGNLIRQVDYNNDARQISDFEVAQAKQRRPSVVELYGEGVDEDINGSVISVRKPSKGLINRNDSIEVEIARLYGDTLDDLPNPMVAYPADVQKSPDGATFAMPLRSRTDLN